MKTICSTLIYGALAALALAHSGVATATDVGVSVQISQPGVYGRIDIGRFPQPQVVYAQPVIITRPVVVVAQQAAPPQPIYMWVPPGHQKNWRKHCGRYGACGVPVYFVQEQWYGEHVKGHGKDKNKNKGQGNGNGKGKSKHDD